jgi:hypothetical protein
MSQGIIRVKNPKINPAEYKNNALELMLSVSLLKIIKELLSDKRVDPSSHSNLVIKAMCKLGYSEVVGVDSSVDKNWVLTEACKHGHSEIIRILLNDVRIDPMIPSFKPLMFIYAYGNLEVIEILMGDSKVDLLTKDNKLIISASECGNLDVIKCLLKDFRVDSLVEGNKAIKLTNKYKYEKAMNILL